MVSATCHGSERNTSRKRRGVIEVDDETKIRKKQKLDRSDSFLSSMCLKVLKSMRSEEDWFEWRFEELVVEDPDYLSVISKPMDFNTIKSKLSKNWYVDIVKEFPEDVRLVFTNAMWYHPREYSVHENAKKLKEIFEYRWESVQKNLACEDAETEPDCKKQSRPEVSSLYLDSKVTLSTNPEKEQRKKDNSESKSSKTLIQEASISTNPVKEQKKKDNPESKNSKTLIQEASISTIPVKEQSEKDNPESKLAQDSKGFVETVPLSLRAAKIRIRFADTIVRARFSKLIHESSDKAAVMMRMQKEKQLFETRQREVKARIEANIIAGKARIEAETSAARLKVRREERLALEKLEEAKSNIKQPLEFENELVNLCRGSYVSGLEDLGLFLIIEEYRPELEDLQEEGEI